MAASHIAMRFPHFDDDYSVLTREISEVVSGMIVKSKEFLSHRR
jgi:hypothetical protein